MVLGDTVLSYVRLAFVNSYSGVCGRQREGQTRGRAGERVSLQSPLVSLPPRRPPPARRRLTGTPVRSRNTDGRTGGRRTWQRSLITGVGLHSAHEDDAAARLFATNILQTLNLERSRNIVVKISQRIDSRKTLRSTPQ